EDDLVNLLIEHSASLQTEYPRFAAAICASNAAIALLDHRRKQQGAMTSAEQNMLANAYKIRATAKRQCLGPPKAIPDCDAAITMMERLQDTLQDAGLAWPPQFQNDLAQAYLDRAIAKRQAIGPAEGDSRFGYGRHHKGEPARRIAS